MQIPLVSIVRCSDHDDEERIFAAVEECISLAAGLDSIICRGDTVLIKPNLIKPAPHETGITTNPYVIKALVKLAKDAGAGKVIVGEGSGVGYDTLEAFRAARYYEILDGTGAELVDFKRGEFVTVPIPNGVIFRRLRVAKPVMEASVIINAAVPKTHDVLPLTIGLKNMKGVIHEGDKRRFHKWGLEQSIVDLNKVVLPQITILDGIIGHDGAGPTHGKPAGLGLLLASTDTVAVDTVLTEIVGVSLEEMKYLRLAEEQGLGCARLDEIEIIGENLNAVLHPYRIEHFDYEKFERMGIRVLDAGACSGCRQVVTAVLESLERENKLHSLNGKTVAYGQMVRLDEKDIRSAVFVGSCTARYRMTGRYIPGCPPPEEKLREFLTRS